MRRLIAILLCSLTLSACNAPPPPPPMPGQSFIDCVDYWETQGRTAAASKAACEGER